MTLTEILYGTFVPYTSGKTIVHRMDGKKATAVPMLKLREQLNSKNETERTQGELKLHIYQAMKGKDFMSTKRIRNMMHISEKTADKVLTAMKNEGLVKSKKIPNGLTKFYVYWKLCEQ